MCIKHKNIIVYTTYNFTKKVFTKYTKSQNDFKCIFFKYTYAISNISKINNMLYTVYSNNLIVSIDVY